MAPRKRSPAKRHLPDNLYEQGGYYTWRNPLTGDTFGIGRDLAKARTEAIAANIHISATKPTVSLVDRLSGAVKTWGQWCDKYDTILAKRGLAENTQRTNKSYGKRARETFGVDTAFTAITVQLIADAIDALIAEGKERSAQGFQSYLKDSFREAMAQGWTTANPAAVTRKVQAKVKRARLTLELFMQLYRAAVDPWLRNAMALAILTAQRREDIAEMQFKRDVHDGSLWVNQGKTGSRVAIPLALRLDVFGMSLEEAVSQCRSTGVVSQYLVHQTKPRGNSPVGSQIWRDTITKRFAELVKDAGADWQGKASPSFHEIRSLALRLYKAQGNVNTQELAGHKDASTTSIYEDARGEWVKVSIR